MSILSGIQKRKKRMAENITEKFSLQCSELIQKIATEEKENLSLAAEKIAQAFLAGKKIYIFGCTHSAILAEDVFYRAGSPTFWQPLWGPGMSITTTPGFLTSAVEHNEEIGREIIKCSRLEKDDVLLVASTSGKNGAPVAVAEEGLKRGASVIILTSSAYKDQKGNHSKYANLTAFKDQAVVIDNHVPLGDAVLSVAGCPMGPVSTVAGSFIMQTVSALAVEKIAQKGITPPVFKSSNAPGGLEHNLALLEKKEVKEAFTLP